MAKRNTFSKPVEYNGIIFDSILEAKFAMRIEETCAYYYHPLSIFYDKKDDTKLGKKPDSNEYQPDFLVRRLSDNKCFLIEIKSSIDRYIDDTLIKLDRAEKYIIDKGYNWEYKIYTEDDFILPKRKFDKLEKAKKTRATVARKKKFARLHNQMSSNKMDYRYNKIPFNRHYKHLNNADYIHFVKKGIVRDKTPD